jgi:antibiotic biosynthesis monooxygenase (ABM) superfamily enzyme
MMSGSDLSVTARQEAGMALIARRKSSITRPRRNTAPLWKKAAIVLTAVAAMVLVLSVLNPDNMGFFATVVVVLVVVAGAVWGMARLLGVHLSLSSWD